MKNFLIFVIAIGVLVGGGSLFYYYVIFLPKQTTENLKNINATVNLVIPKQEELTPFEAQEKETEDVVRAVSRIISLPTNETPNLATVSEPERLKDQPFFANAQAGDKVLVYTQAQRAILWRPSVGKVIEVSALNLAPNPEEEQ